VERISLRLFAVDVNAAAGSGHIKQRPNGTNRSRGSYRVSVYAGADPLTGRELRFRETAKTVPEPQILLGRLLEQADAGRRPESRVLASELLAQYLSPPEPEGQEREMVPLPAVVLHLSLRRAVRRLVWQTFSAGAPNDGVVDGICT